MKKAFARISVFATAVLLAASASAYNFYLTYDANGNPLPAKWDLTKLANNTVYFYVADSSLDTADMLPGDGYLPVISELRAAAAVWNAVPGSALQIGYGGLFHSNGTGVTSADNSPDDNVGINVDFCDGCFPPGLLAYSIPTYAAVPAPGATFMPIQLSKLLFPKLPHGITGNTLASWSELFFATAVHEFGHNLGLQHTTVSSVMSTMDTSASSKSRPLAADDIAGVTSLYPVTQPLATMASISGKVTFTDGTPVDLAPVVAIPAEGDPVEALTHQDGTYEIDGIPAGLYFVYTQSLPAPGEVGYSTRLGLVYPFASDGKTPIPPNCDGGTNCYFETTFYPGTNSWHLAKSFPMDAGATQAGINFQVAPRSSLSVSPVRSYGFLPGNTTVGIFSPPIFTYGAPQTLVLYNPNNGALPSGIIDSNNNLIPGISFDGLGDLLQILPDTLGVYVSNGTPAVYMNVVAAFPVPFPGPPGARHLLISSPDNVYVLPSAVRAVDSFPPLITSVQPVGDGTLTVNGTNLYGDTRVMFDGVQAALLNVVSSQQLVVSPPPAQPGFVTHVVALDPDGQSSLFLTGDSGVVTYTYPGSAAPALSVTSGSIPAGGSMTVDVVGTNTSFISGETYVGFGTSNVVVTSVDVIGPGHLQATATNNGSSAVPTTNINVTTGLSVIASALGYSVTGM
jgi:hypothetical protein